MIKKTYKVEGMHCTSCASMLELDLEDAGVVAKCDFAKESLEVELNEGKEKDVFEVVAKAGYKLVA